MIVEVLRTLTDWLNDPTNGVVTQLAAVTRDAGDPLPTVGTIADATRNNQVAQAYLPTVPGIAVNIEEIRLLDPNTVMIEADGLATVTIRYGLADVDTKDAMRDVSYVLRAIARSLRLFNRDYRTRNGIAVYSYNNPRVVPPWQSKEDQLVVGAIQATWQYRDTAP